MCFVKMNVEFDWYRYLFAGRKKMCPTKTKFEILSLSIFSYFFFFFCCFVGLSAAGFFFCRRMETNEKINIFVTNKKESKSERIWNYSSAFFNVFVVSCLFIYLFIFFLTAVAVFVGWLRREWVWWEKECFCCCWWVSVYFRWIRYNNLQKTEIVESINAGFILMAPTTQPHFHLFFNALSLFCACFHLRPCMCWTEYERTHRERAHDTGIV